MPKTNDLELIRAPASVELTAARKGGAAPRVSIDAYSGGTMSVPGYGEVVIDLAGLVLPEQVPLLADHDNRLEGIVGYGEATIKAGRLTIAGALLDTPIGNQVRDLAAGGLTLRASVGVRPLETATVRKGESLQVNERTITAERPLLLVKRARLAETSIVAVGADESTAVSITAKGQTAMAENSDNTNTNAAAAGNEPAQNQSTPDGLSAERQRSGGILRIAGQHPEIAARAVTEGWDLQRTELEVMRSSRPSGRIGIVGNEAPIGPPRDILAAAALLHAGSPATAEKAWGGGTCQRAADLRITSSVDLCRAALMLEMRDVPHDRGEMIRAAFSTSTLTGALAAATQREAMTAFQEAPSAWRMIAKTRPAPDFRKREGLRPYLSDGRLEKIAKDGEIKHAGVDQETYPFQIHTFARMFSVDRQTIINDDIGAVFELLRELGRQAGRTIADEVAALILANPGDFFSAGNDNFIDGADSALGVEALGVAVQTLREQKDSDGKPIDVSPQTLLVPPALEAVGRQVLNSLAIVIDGHAEPVEAPAGNPWRGIAILAVDSRLADESKAWYLFADPANIPAIVVSFLNGREGPVVEQDDAEFSLLGQRFRCYIDFGVDAADPRGAVKSKGEA